MEPLYVVLSVVNVVGWVAIIVLFFLMEGKQQATIKEMEASHKKLIRAVADLQKEIGRMAGLMREKDEIAQLKVGGTRREDPTGTRNEEPPRDLTSSSTRWRAVSVAAGGAQDSSIDSLEDLLQSLLDNSVRVRLGAMSALARLNDLRATPHLIHALNDENEVVRRRARRSLMELTSEDFGENPDRWTDWWKRENS